MLRVRVSTASAEIIETELITAGRRGLECSFEFNSAWDSLAKTVIVNGVVKRDIVLVSDTITVPGECLAREQFPLRIGVYGANGAGEIVIPTIWANFGKILPSARPSGVDPDEVTPDVVAQIQANSSDALRLAQDLIRRADSGDFDGRDGATGPSGADGADGLNGSSIWTVAAEDVHGGLILIADLVGRTNLTPAKNDLILDGDWNIYRIDLVGRSTVSATRFGNVGEGGGASGVFVAQYGVSTADEIYEASTGGNACILPYAFPGVVYYLSWLGEMQSITPSGTVIEKSAVFTGVDGDEKTTIRVTGSTWFSPSTVKYARTASPTFTGTPKAPTAEAGTNSTQIASTAFVNAAIQAALEGFTPGQTISEELKQALLQLAWKVAYIDAGGETYYQDLYDALYPPAVLASIRATFAQGSTVIYNTDSLDVLKPLLTVTAVYDDGSTETVAAEDYTLSGTLATGISTITASYQGKTATFQVTVTAAPQVYLVTNELTGCTTDNSAASVVEGSAYAAQITASSGYTLVGAVVTITMGNQDITASAYSGGVISIPAVTGALVISVAAAAVVLSSITATYTQSGTVYDTDSLDSLKTDLVVTAVYSDSSTQTVPAADYTLSGTLTVGTSTITVSYGGKTTTFSVTVSENSALYPLNSGTHTFSSSGRKITVSDGNHFLFERADSGKTSSYVNLTNISANDSTGASTNPINNQPTWHTIPAGAESVLEVKNITATQRTTDGAFAVGIHGTGTTTIISSGNIAESSSIADVSVSKTFDAATDIGCIFLYANKYVGIVSADIYLYVNGERWI